MEENTKNEQQLEIDEEQLQDVTGGAVNAGMSRRTRFATQQPSGSNDAYERAMRIGKIHLANGNNESANFFFDVARTHLGK
jgi:hypothetical protein